MTTSVRMTPDQSQLIREAAALDNRTVKVPEGPLSKALAPLGTVQAVEWQRMCDLLALRRRQREG